MRRDLDRDLRFALWPQRPAWLVEPVTDLLTGRRLGDLTCEEAADALQLIASLQVVRSAVFCIPVLGLAALLDLTGADAGWAPVMWTLSMAAVLLLPLYATCIGVLRLQVRRSGADGEPLAAAHPLVVPGLRTAPWVALVVAVALGLLLH